MEVSITKILGYSLEEFYGLDEEIRQQYTLIADKFLREQYRRELSGENWIIYVSGHGIVEKSSNNPKFETSSDLLQYLENRYKGVAFMVHRESFRDEFLSEKPKSKEPTLNERLELRLTGL